MNKDKGPLTWLKNRLFQNEDSPDKKPGKYPYLLIVILFGIAIMLVANIYGDRSNGSGDIAAFNNKNESQEDEPTFGQKKSTENNQISSYEDEYEARLTEALEQIVGVGDVSVIVNVDSTEKKVLEKNTVTQSQSTDEVDQQGGKRTVEDLSKEEQLVIIRNGENETPIVVETKKPAIRGVLVVAKGADNIQIEKWIIEAVTRTLDVPSHKVSVLPKKSKGDE